MFDYYDLFSLRQFLHDVVYAPNGKGGFYCKRSQRKRRKLQRRLGGIRQKM